jgi:hypothetical protein
MKALNGLDCSFPGVLPSQLPASEHDRPDIIAQKTELKALAGNKLNKN